MRPLCVLLTLLLSLALAAAARGDDVPGDGPLFVDRAAAVGIDFVHFNGMSGKLYFPEMTGAGAALFDYDNDGDLDAYLVQGRMLGEAPVASATFPPRHPQPFSDRLYRNDLEIAADGTRTLGFTDVTAAAKLAPRGYGMGVAAGDFDGDGWTDLYLTNFGPNQLLKNNGDGTFTDVTAASGTDDARWSVPAVFFDYDRDGWLDLYVGNYVDFRLATHKTCTTVAGVADYCGPRSYPSLPDRLFRNRGDGTFEDVTEGVGLAAERGPALGAVARDFDGDGRLDLYVANDGEPNQLWLARQAPDGTVRFENGALLGGCAVSEDGQPQASMGVVAADLTGDGATDLFMTHLTRETNTLYVNDGSGIFEDRSQESGLGQASWNATGFGTTPVDVDNDGWLDLFVANGAVKLIEEQVRARNPYPLAQANQLFRATGAGRFSEVTGDAAGPALALSEVSRGVAVGDVDDDGDADLLVANNSGPARLLVNQTGQDHPWLGLRLVTGEAPRDALGARVAVVRKGAPTLWREVATDGSYASASDPRVLFGLAGGAEVELVRVVWPSGREEEFRGVAAGAYTTLREGTGTARP